MLNAFALCKFSCISVRSPVAFYWSACTKPGKWVVMHMYVRGFDFPFWFFYWILELFRQCGIFRIVSTVWYFCLSSHCNNIDSSSDRAKLVVWSQTSPLMEMMGSYKCFAHVSKMSSITYNQENSVIIKNAIILNIIHNIFNLRDTEVVIGRFALDQHA
jgi:hypothetical protein